MPLLDLIREQKLIELARERFDPELMEAEFKVLRESASSQNPSEPNNDTPRSVIRAEFIRWLATDPEATPHIDQQGIRVRAAIISSKLDLDESQVQATLNFRQCAFQREINLRSAVSRGIFLLDCSLAEEFSADRITVRGPLFLQRIQSSNKIRLPGAQIGGSLDCCGAKLAGPNGALLAHNANILGNVFMSADFECSGTINLVCAQIAGDLTCSGAKLTATVDALLAQNVSIGGNVYLNQNFESAGAVRLFGAQITGSLYCSGATFAAAGDALSVDQAKIGGDVSLNNGLKSSGTIRLLSIKIGGDLDCSGAKLTTTGIALGLDRASIGGSVFMPQGFESSGEVRLLGAQVGGDLDCSGAKLTARTYALSAHNSNIGQNVFLNNGFESPGEIALPNARIGGALICSGARLTTTGDALSADGANISGDVCLNLGFSSSGTISLRGAHVGGDIDCSGAKLTAPLKAVSADSARIGGNIFLADGFESSGIIRFFGAQIGGEFDCIDAVVGKVDCVNMELAGDLIWQGIKKCAATELRLTGLKAKNLRDDRDSWPEEGKLALDGLIYEELTRHSPPTPEDYKNDRLGDRLPLVATDRIAWLMLQGPDRRTEPQPWMQLAKYLESRGDHTGAKHVVYRFHCLQAKNSGIFLRPWKIAFAWLEEAPLRILYSIATLLICGTLIFAHAGMTGALAPTEKDAYAAFASGKPIPAAYPALNPFVYVLENSVPLVRLGEDDRWAPDQRHIATGWFTGYWFLMWIRWILILSGWFQATVLAAALSSRFKP
jgi:hypothetical protein